MLETLYSRLTRRIVAAVFLSILVVEAAILIPSVINFRADIETRLIDTGRIAATAFFRLPDATADTPYDTAVKDMLSSLHIVGVARYDAAGNFIGQYGDVHDSRRGKQLKTEENQYIARDQGFALILREPAAQRWLLVEFDSGWIEGEVSAFVIRIAGLVLIISVFVTGIVTFVVSRTLVRPILSINANLSRIKEDPENLEIYKIDYNSKDELGDSISLLNNALAEISESRRRQVEVVDRRFLDFAEISADWFWEMDASLRFSYFSERFTEVTGVPQERLLGVTREENGNPGATDEAWQKHLCDLSQRRPFMDFIHPRTRPDGTVVWLQIRGRPAFGANGEFLGFRGTGTDITEQLSNEYDLRQAKEAAEEANRAKSEFLSSMSHELRTPMNSILGFSQLLADDPNEPLSENHQRFVQQILSNGEHLQSLIDQVLDLAKVESGNLEVNITDVEVAAAIEDCLAMSAPLAKGGNILVHPPEIEPSLSRCRADPRILSQVLLNLLSNAIKYNSEGGSVRIRAFPTDGGKIRFTVTDTGEGIALKYQHQIFEPFNRLGHEASTIKGSGIGLAISKKLTEAMGGAIGFDTTRGEGSTFWVEVPKP